MGERFAILLLGTAIVGGLPSCGDAAERSGDLPADATKGTPSSTLACELLDADTAPRQCIEFPSRPGRDHVCEVLGGVASDRPCPLDAALVCDLPDGRHVLYSANPETQTAHRHACSALPNARHTSNWQGAELQASLRLTNLQCVGACMRANEPPCIGPISCVFVSIAFAVDCAEQHNSTAACQDHSGR